MSAMDHLARSPKQLGAIIMRVRRERKLTQADLAQKVGLRQEAISKIESGNGSPRLSKILDVLAALDLDITIGPRRTSSSADIEDLF